MRPGMKALVMTARRGDERDGREMNYPRGGYEAEYPRDEHRGYEGNYRSRGNRSEYDGRDINRMEYNGSGMNYGGVEGRFRDRRGREHYDNGRYAPKRSYGGEARGYESYQNEGERYDGGMPEGRYVPPEQEMNPIGFTAHFDREDETEHERPDDDERHKRGHGNTIDLDRARGEREQQPKKFTEEIAAEWMRKLKNVDGSSGPHWTMEQAKQIVTQKSLKVSPIEFYAALNMMYSDYSQVAKKLGANVMDLCTGLAVAFLEDKDAKKDKLMRYYECIVSK